MAITYVSAAASARPPSHTTTHDTTESSRLARRAGLRSCALSRLRDLDERHDHAISPAARALIEHQTRDLRQELVAALRGDAAAIESPSVKSDHPTVQ